MNSGTPLISVVLPCYNAESYIQEAIESILQQTHTNLELIVIDDGSTDGSLKIIRALAATDDRVKIIARENRGLIASLNEGIAVAQGDYIARMDADDISLPDRLSRQLTYLQQHQLDLVGGSILRFYPGTSRRERRKDYPESHDELVACLLSIKSRLPHPAVLAKKSLLLQHPYNPRYKYAEDYALWLELALSGDCRFGNLPEIVLRYRAHATQVTATNRRDNRAAKKQAFIDLMVPRAKNDRALVESIYNLWQSKSYLKRWRGAVSMRRWLNYLQEQDFFNPHIRKYLLQRMWEQLF